MLGCEIVTEKASTTLLDFVPTAATQSPVATSVAVTLVAVLYVVEDVVCTVTGVEPTGGLITKLDAETDWTVPIEARIVPGPPRKPGEPDGRGNGDADGPVPGRWPNRWMNGPVDEPPPNGA
ncbi:MAG TPA: hypothetical protein VG708_09990 [Mycobacteriales bacterium]|nr:hypothetical protein [Mycobacteriales bacterium]